MWFWAAFSSACVCMHVCMRVCLVGGGGEHSAVLSDKPCSLLTSTAFGLLSVCLCVSSTYCTFLPITKLRGILESLCPCVQLYPDDIFWTAQPFIFRLDIVIIDHHGPDCRANSLICCLKGQGHKEGSWSNMTVSTISSDHFALFLLSLLIILHPNFIW